MSHRPRRLPQRPDPAARHRALESLGRAPRPVTCLGVSQDTQLSSLVVVPLLKALVDEGIAAREPDPTGAWAYRLTPRGHRELRRRTPPGAIRPDPRRPMARPRAS